MKKRFWAVPLAGVAAVGAGYAADLHTPHLGSSCPTGFVGSYHFVNNQIPEGTPAGTIWATWDSGNACTVTSYKILNHVQHFRCTGMAGALTSAYMDLPGRLVLSDFTCRRVPKLVLHPLPPTEPFGFWNC
jgi:hypothetical protein